MEQISRMLVSADSFFDTRVEVLKYLNPSFNVQDYLTRDGDNFKYYGDVYKAIYDRRDKRLLLRANLSRCIDLVKTTRAELVSEGASASVGITVNIDVNIYPYILSNDEEKQLSRIITNLLPDGNINIVRKRLTKKVIKAYQKIIDYNGLEAVNRIIISEGIELGECVGTSIIVPDSIHDITAFRDIPQDDFLESLMTTLGYFINLQFIAKKLFDIRIDEKKSNAQ